MSKNVDKDQIIANLRAGWDELHRHFKRAFRESMELRSFIILYATIENDDNRAEIDKDLAEKHPGIWRDIQEWRKSER